MKIHFDDPQFSFQLLRILGSAASRQADVGEALATAQRIAEGDFDSWAREWHGTAERVGTIAERALAAGHRASAADSFLRAANYHRAAGFYLHGDPHDPRIRAWSDASAHCFEQGLRASGCRFEALRVPYEGSTLPALFYPAASERRPTLVVQTGFDGTIDGLYPWALAAVRRGWHCLAFEGPGQGRVIRTQGLPFRPDWEHVVSAVIDHLVTRPEVDTQRIALLGVSFGGYLAPRAAAFEPRIAACIANGGVMDFIGPHIPPGMSRAAFAAILERQPLEVDAEMHARAARSVEARWSMENGQFVFGAKSPSDWLRKLLDYTLEPVAQRIACPMLVVDVEHEQSFPGEAKKLYDALRGPKTWMLFTEAEGAGDHCQTGSPALAQQRIFDWLEETLR